MNDIREHMRKLHALADAIEVRAVHVESYCRRDSVYPEELRVYANIARKIAEDIELESKNASKT